jgi:8-oxo-dGTP pyrophosphatase MutT (NUDIX family)
MQPAGNKIITAIGICRMDGVQRPERQLIVALGWVQRADRVLLVQRHEPALPAAHGKWELPGGKLRFGEHPATAVAREVLEETGYRVNVSQLLPYLYSTVWDYPDRRQHVILLVFACQAGPAIATPADPRIVAHRWLPPDQIDFNTTLPGVEDFVSWWRQHGHTSRD